MLLKRMLKMKIAPNGDFLKKNCIGPISYFLLSDFVECGDFVFWGYLSLGIKNKHDWLNDPKGKYYLDVGLP